MKDTFETNAATPLQEYISILTENTEQSCTYQELNDLQEEARELYRRENNQWIEKLAEYYARHSCRSMEEREPFDESRMHAQRLYEWICEESHYIEETYPEQTQTMREHFEQKLEYIALQQEAYELLTEDRAGNFLQRMAQCLTASGYTTTPLRKSRLMAYLIRFGNELCDLQMGTILTILHSMKENGIYERTDQTLIEETLIHQIQRYDEEISALWYSNDTAILETRISLCVQLISLYLMMDFKDKECRHKLLAARIYRYLSKLKTPYSTLLKDKAYTILSDESSIDNRLSWEALTDFNVEQFIGQLVDIRINELNQPVEAQDNKWEQLDNGTNILTLDKDGFTLSTTFPHLQQSWKGRKEKVELLDKRFFLAAFLKPTYLFKNCKTIKDFQLYWKQLHEDYPIYKHKGNSPTKKYNTDETATAELPETESTSTLPEADEEVTIAITNTDNVGLYLEAVILDEPYRGKKAILPCTLVNACYSYIPNFDLFIKKNDTFKVKVVENNQEGTRVSLAQSYNEYIYADNIQLGKIPALMVNCEENKIKWLLMTGTTCVTPYNRWVKPQKGNIYLLEFLGMDHQMMNARATVSKNKVFMPIEEFFNEVKRHLQEFIEFQQKQRGEADQRQQNEQILKDRNNPFTQALQQLNLSYEDEAEENEIQLTKDETGSTGEKKQPILHESLNMDIAEELIYCIGQLAEEKEDICELFNVYNYLQLLARFVGNKQLEEYHSICSDYIYTINHLINKPEEERFTTTSTYKLQILSARMEMLGIERYGKNFKFYRDVATILQASNDSALLESLQTNENPTIRSMARYFSILPLLSENDDNLKHIIYQNINGLLGYQEKTQKAPSVPIYFGSEGVCCEFKTSAFIHADKDSNEDQSLVLARVIASFMNTDGGTLYIGVNDKGYLTGILEDLSFVHNDRDNYLRTVNSQIIRLLGDNREAHNRYQEYIRCNLHEYDNQRMVLAFRVAPINEVVTLGGKVYTRSGSSCICKPEKNVKDFIAQRRITALNSVPRQPIFPTVFSEERQEYAFTLQEEEEMQYTRKYFVVPPPVKEPETTIVQENIQQAAAEKPTVKVKSSFKVQTSVLRTNPLQKKPEMGYTNTHHFISLFNNGKIACSASPKIGVWGENQGGKVICSYDTEGDEDILVCVTRSGEVGIANLKKGFSDTNTPFAFVNDVNDLLFVSPASSSNHLLLIAEKDETKRYRIIRLSDFNKPLGIQPKLSLLLKPEKGTYIYADILDESIMEKFEDDKTSLDSFDQYNAGRFWEHTSYKQCVDILSEKCNLPF